MAMRGLVILMCALLSTVARMQDNYAITNINTSPGLYYEKLHNIRFKRAEWKVTVFLEMKGLEKEDTELIRDYAKICRECKSIRSLEMRCDTIMRKRILEQKFLDQENLRREAIEIAGEVMLPDIDNNPRSIVKRGAPFEFIGHASKYLFGTLTAEDGEYFNEQIDKIYQDQSHLVKIIKNQTHIISGKLHELSERAENHQAALKQTKGKLNEVLGIIDKMAQESSLLNYTTRLNEYTTSAEMAIDHQIATIEKFILGIRMAREGKLHESLLSGPQLNRVIREIHDTAKEYELPIPGHHHRIEEITKLAEMQIGYYEGRILIVIRLPLVDKTTYHLYQMHPWPMTQKLENHTISAQVIPRTPYLGISDDHREYFLLEEEHLRHCSNTWYCHLCTMQLPLIETSVSKSCEILLLISPNQEIIRECDIRIKRNHDPYWKRLNSIGAWLYSLNYPETIQIICKNLKDRIVTLNGTGILYIREKCMGRTRTVRLPGIEIFTQKEQFIYQPNLALNISEISPKLLPHDLISYLENNPVKSRVDHEIGKSLYEIENELDELSSHKRDRKHHEHLVYGGYLVQIGFAFLVLGICCHKQIRAKYTNWRATRKGKNHMGSVLKEESAELAEITTTDTTVSRAPLQPPVLPKQRAQVN